MVYNKRSTQWLSRVCLYIGIGALLTIVAIQWNHSVPEIEVLNSLETVNKLQLSIKNFFK
ncbi:MAG TPA: hypothetical protein VIM93_06445 [Kangiella sp.]|uniref:hypothetical protein n=1 Tax=Kangiella sp. TaxID=1920245 RepID=UPI002F95ACD4